MTNLLEAVVEPGWASIYCSWRYLRPLVGILRQLTATMNVSHQLSQSSPYRVSGLVQHALPVARCYVQSRIRVR
jgi:hypothetical protein